MAWLAKSGDWDEQKHPRDAAGRFGEGGADPIGKTKSGKPIPGPGAYHTHAPAAVAAAHPDWSARDHMNAWVDHSNAGNTALASAHMAIAGQKRQGGSGATPGHQPLSEHEHAALKRYQGTGFVEMQSHLRDGGGGSDEAQKHIHHLDSAISKGTLDKDTTLYRGMGGYAAEQYIKAAKPGARIREKGYISTTAKRKVAHEFARSRDEQEEEPTAQAILHIRVPRAHPVLAVPHHVDNVSSHREQEHILPRETHLRVKRVEKDADGVHHIHMEVIPK